MQPAQEQVGQPCGADSRPAPAAGAALPPGTTTRQNVQCLNQQRKLLLKAAVKQSSCAPCARLPPLFDVRGLVSYTLVVRECSLFPFVQTCTCHVILSHIYVTSRL